MGTNKEKCKNLEKKLNNVEFLSPEYVYYYVSNHNTKFYVNSKKNVFKEELIFEDNGIKHFSCVSGTIMGIKKIDKKDYLVIKNDYHEKYKTQKSLRKKIDKLSKKEILDILTNDDAACYSSNIKYFVNNFNSIDCLVLNLLICEESEKIYSEVFNKHNSDILEVFDAISQIFDIKNPIIMLSDTDEKNIEFVTNLSGMYPNIRIVLSHDKYPASHPLLITRKLNLTNALVLTSMDLYYLYSIIKRNKKVFEKEIFITCPDSDFDYLVNTKLNVTIKDILNSCSIYLSDDNIICKNSAIKAECLTENDIIDTTIDSLVIVKKSEDNSSECINCGLCNKNCPQNINPQFYKINKLPFPGKCIGCNMCSYVCPCKIRKDM